MQRTDSQRGQTARSPPPRAFLGFTLVEVMVALAVVAVALPALLVTLSQQLDGLRYLEDRTQAQWVAANRLAELRLVIGAKGSLQTGRWSAEPGGLSADLRVYNSRGQLICRDQSLDVREFTSLFSSYQQPRRNRVDRSILERRW